MIFPLTPMAQSQPVQRYTQINIAAHSDFALLTCRMVVVLWAPSVYIDNFNMLLLYIDYRGDTATFSRTCRRFNINRL